VRFIFIDLRKTEFPVSALCRVLQVSRSGYYAWRSRPKSRHHHRDATLRAKVVAYHRASRGTYGSPRVTQDLRDEGERVAQKRVARLMREQRLKGCQPRAYRATTDSAHNDPVAKNALERDFSPEGPDRVWVSDITYIKTWEGWLYLAVVIDLWSRKVVGWSVGDSMKTQLVLDALTMATGLRNAQGVTFHSDRGSQYTSGEFQRTLKKNRMKSSMSRKGNCWDNAVAESFFGTLKNELVYRQPWVSQQAARDAVIEYISCFYNPKRRHSFLGGMSPMAYEACGVSTNLMAA